VPLALALGLIAGLLEFVPFLGPFLAAIPMILVALTAGPEIALYALLLFVVVQQVESNLLTPLVARRAMALPPVLVLLGAVALALLFGVLGAIFATPLIVLIVVLVKALYMQDVLGERVELPGERKAA
jgi:predicted PurR-regulated permease PerM